MEKFAKAYIKFVRMANPHELYGNRKVYHVRTEVTHHAHFYNGLGCPLLFT